MKKVALKFYGHNNLGDDLFVKILANRYADQFHVVTHKKLPGLADINNISIHKSRIVSSILGRLGSKLNRNDVWLGSLAKRSDLMVHIGGSLFIEDGNLDHWRKEEDFYAQCKVPYYVLGCNFGPYKSKSFLKIVNNILRGAEDVCFRDNTSYNQFRNINNTRVASDIVFGLDTSHYSKEQTKSVVISVIDCENRFSRITKSDYEQAIANTSIQLISEGYDVTLMSFCEFEGDEKAIQRILRLLEPLGLKKLHTHFYHGDIEAALNLIASCEIMISTRFHATILGLLFNKKVLPIIYSNKTADVLYDMKFRGPSVEITSIKGFGIQNFKTDSLYKNDVSEQIKSSAKQFQILDKILDKK